MKKFLLVFLITTICMAGLTYLLTRFYKEEKPIETFEEDIPEVSIDKYIDSNYNGSVENISVNKRGMVQIKGKVYLTSSTNNILDLKIYIGHQVYYTNTATNNYFNCLLETSESDTVTVSVWVVDKETNELKYLVGYRELVLTPDQTLTNDQKIIIVMGMAEVMILIGACLIIVLTKKEQE